MAALSGQKTVATAGTAVALGLQQIGNALAIKALPGNTGTMYVGNDGNGDVSNANGFPLKDEQVIIFDYVENLSSIYVDSTVNGEGVAWMVLQA